MKDRLNNKQKALNTNVEYAQEFGDLNSAKFFEYPFMNQKQKKEKQKEKN